MKRNVRTALIVIFSCLTLISCEDSSSSTSQNKALLDAFDTTQSPIMYGEKDEGDMSVVGLYRVTEKLDNGNYRGSVYCSGTIIHPNWVLTAAHCVADTEGSTVTPSDDNSNMMIYVGSDRKNGGYVYHIAGADKIYWHSQYVDITTTGHDIALIKLKNPMTREDVVPILPHPKWLILNDDMMPVNMKLVGFGYDHNGVIEVKNQKTMPITIYCGSGNPGDSVVNGCSLKNEVHVQGCHPNPYYCESRGPSDYYTKVKMTYGTLYHSMQEGGECNGDSGGPSLYTVGGIQYVAGITSGGDSVCRGYNISTAVADYYDWIISIAPEVAEQYREICDNGVDDDGNGKIDNADPACVYCGNNIVNLGEECDKDHFSNDRTTCVSWDSTRFSGGNVSCNNDCTVNYDNCDPIEYCGDGKLKDGEECDGSVFMNGIKSCTDMDGFYTSGTLRCTDSCKIDQSGCKAEAVCGDGVVNGEEVCDKTKFYHNRTLCNTIFPELYSSGKVKCNDTCGYDVSDCIAWCGNGSLNRKVGEVCDGEKFGGESCETLVGPGSTGTLKCINGCTQIDTSGCSKPSACGDGIVDTDEECDGSNIPGDKIKCSDYDASYSKGEVSCNANCTLNYSLCETGPICGNNKVDDGELCDGTKFSGNRFACKTLFPELYSAGSVKCTNDCNYDTSDCIAWCGNGSVNTKSGDIMLNEACDHGEVDKFPTSKNSCEKVVGKGSTGTLICADDCKSILTVGCSEPAFCGDSIVNNSEQCDGMAFLDDKTQCAQWDSKYASGNVKCTTNCGLDLSACELAPVCGDNIVNGSELCDKLSFKDNKTLCSAWDSKYASGRVSCNSSCELDYSDCKEVVIVPDEICDNHNDDDGNGKIDCEDPACLSDALCKPKEECGNGIVDGDEECDKTAFLLDEDQCSEWIKVFKSGTVTCNADCTVNYDACSTEKPEICDNKIDDNGNDRIDCDDYECVNFEGCLAATDPDADNPDDPTDPDDPTNPDDPTDPDQPGDSESNHSSGSDCSSTPRSSAPTPFAMILGLLVLGLCARRRRLD